MKSDAQTVFMQLLKAKEELARLEKEYRSICECNEKLPGISKHEEIQEYRKIYRTCQYHKPKLMKVNAL